MTVLAVLAVLPSFCWSFKFKIQYQEATVTVLTAMAVLVMTATPLKLTPPFSEVVIPRPTLCSSWNQKVCARILVLTVPKLLHFPGPHRTETAVFSGGLIAMLPQLL